MSSKASDITTASLEYITAANFYEEEKPYRVIIASSKDAPCYVESNIFTEWHHDVAFEDVRSKKGELSFDKEGFKYLLSDTKLGTRFEPDELRADLEEMTEVLKRDVGAEMAICYDIRLRSRESQNKCEMVSESRSKVVKPVTIAHTDHTKSGGLRRISKHLSAEERAKYLSGDYHCRIFNLWKPLVDAIEDNPLALCDPRTVATSDLVHVDRVTNGWAGEIYYIKYAPGQVWYWLSRQTRNEVCAFLTYDSNMKTQLTFCPHASFMNPAAPPDAEPRQSVEIRIITFNKVTPGTGAVFDSTCHGLYS